MRYESGGFDLQDIFLLIGLKAGTGELVLESGNNIGTMTFYQGKILQASSPYSRTIGDLLVEEGIISEAELIDTLALQKKSRISPIGILFVKTGKVAFDVIERMMHEQIRQAAREFMTWTDLRASFAEKDIQPVDRIHLEVNEFIIPAAMNAAREFLSGIDSNREKTASASSYQEQK